MRNQRGSISTRSQIFVSALVLIIMLGMPVQGDPPVNTPPDFVLPAGLFCLRVTDIKEVPGDPENDRFEFSFEVLNWAGTAASGMQFALNQATGFQGIVDESPFFAGASVDGGGRPLGPGSDDANFPPFDGTLGTKTGMNNNWTVAPATVLDTQRKEWNAGTPVPGRDLLGVPGPSNTQKTQQACDTIPGCQLDTAGAPFLTNIETVDNGAPSIDGLPDNVLDGFVIDIDDFDECEMVGFNWFLTDGSGNPIGTSGQGNQFGFGTFNLFRPSQGNPAMTAALDADGPAAVGGRCADGPAAGTLNDGSGSNTGANTNPATMFVAATILGILFQGEAGAGITLPFQNALDNVLGALINGRLLPPLGFLVLFGSFTIISVLVLAGIIHHAFILLTLILGGFLGLSGSIFQSTSSVGDISPSALTASITLPDSRDFSDPAPIAGNITINGPSPWVSVTGPLATDGTFTATGTGTVAGNPNIAVEYKGNLTASGSLTGEYTMGKNGGLPGGVPIVYGVDAEFNDQSPAPLPAPVLPPDSTVNVASFRPATDPNGGVAGGGMVAIFGSNLLDESGQAALRLSPAGAGSRTTLGGPPTGLIQAETVPLPTELGGTSVRINNILSPLFFASAGQINAQVPFGLPAGTYPVQVFRGAVATAAQEVTIADVSPGIFTTNQQGTGDGAILHATSFQLVTPGNPAVAGEFLSIFCTGLGALDTPVVSGDIPPSPAPRTVSTPQATIGGVPATVDFSGLAPGFVGLYQVNVIVPSGLAPGSHDLVLTIDGVPSNTVTLSIQ